jgi:predicted nucleic acid-binding protein
MTFIDSNIIIPLFKKKDEYKNLAEAFFENLSEEYLVSGVCLLELRFILRKYRLKDEDIEKAVNALFSFKELKFLPITPGNIEDSFKYIKEYGLGFFDSVILATMVNMGDFVIISEDTDFDKVGFLKRRSLCDVVPED